MATMVLIRDQEDEHNTKGKLEIFNNNGKKVYECLTLELPFKDNRRKISSIPKGEYKVVKRHSPKLNYTVLHILDVDNRSYIYFHIGNYIDGDGGYSQVEGCILVGDYYDDLAPSDGIEDIVNSEVAFKKIMDLMNDDVHTLIITENY